MKRILHIMFYISVLLCITAICYATFRYYNRGTFEDYEEEHLKYQLEKGWTAEEIKNGKISTSFFGEDKIFSCRTMKEFGCVQNINEEDDYVWEKYTENDLEILNEVEYRNLINDWFFN